jgi:hypothetical protein
MVLASKDVGVQGSPGKGYAGGESGSDDFNVGGKEGVEGAGPWANITQSDGVAIASRTDPRARRPNGGL